MEVKILLSLVAALAEPAANRPPVRAEPGAKVVAVERAVKVAL
jgi:hypothetical protein